ncbi:ribonuclease J [Rarobacter faecitabidus]|uniref:Ribonuclease J n=1 Tax=Rarobacter faecitabidus TaxID=13243 RepID=A0A542ZWA9_RARFA|nr:ribonuclease J [Rarobacter faecitabidus]TQL64653.1 ribonuclease J [Rarobacter faecitabidus]
MSLSTPELLPPPPLEPGTLRIVPLGGLGEVGRNMSVLEYEGRLFIIDCGVLFPEEHQPGVDLILPDFDYIAHRLGDVEALVLTHGHEDHIGAVPYLLRLRPDIPVVGSTLTLAFVTAKLKEHRINPRTVVVKEGETHKFGAFECEFVAVNHSIPDALAVAVTTPAGTVLNTGDFKMDQLPLDGRITDLRSFARLGERGVDLFMVDSTNAEVPGFVTPEREIGPVLDQVFAESSKRIIVASFASHVHRVQQVLDASYAHGRKVALVGRSMIRNMKIAADLGYLRVPEDVLVDLRYVENLPDDEIVLMCTGSQGEPMAALSRIANGNHKVSVGPGDTVVLASSLIPGNENAVFRVINGLTKLGARVVHSGNAKVHVSGHSGAGELLYCYNIVRPRNVMPIHGETRHLVANGALAVKTGVPPERVVIAEDGIVVDLKDSKAQIVGAVPCGLVYVDGSSVGKLTDSELQDRRVLGEEGFISVFAVVDSKTREIVAGPIVQARGVAEDDSVLEGVVDQIRESLLSGLAENVGRHQLQQGMRRVVGRFASGRLRRRPMILPVVVEA